ncbi:glycoside hydrolase [Punctularia strigosozonata HHB-11173 SS5]|uniref:glycoside hydrolase n=1 Tax=Punctularia strigosozonata (strain HHB-11173) TaxID=741275 RepID=UPI0004417CA9|nr:glycoside hydrolase [Punctularia strigosozonata HHB-11173 SS5]EIN09820.1 glycoside hydrolase [Punctularia strigosozonata HHB-11173 SS5]
MLALLQTALLLLVFGGEGHAYDASRNDNLAVYYGQNSYGATHPNDEANWQQALSTYCQDDTINAFPLAFLDVFFGTGGEPSINLANTCNDVDNPVFSGTDLPNCQFMAADIQACQAKGKIVTLSMGGATGAATFTSDAQAQAFATQIWNLFLGGTSDIRPFGAAVLDGIDLDIEGGGSTGLAAFVTQIRTLAAGASKTYYITGAPQCPFPDAFLGSVINSVGFDALYVQFYNNFCGLTNFDNPNDWNFATWDNWAKTTSPNKNVKIFIGAPASPTAAGSGYVDSTTLASIISQTRSQFSSFGGVMLWDASQAFANGRYDLAVKSALTNGGSSVPTSSTVSSSKTSTTSTSTSKTTSTTSKPASTSTTTSSAPSTTTSTATSGSCAGVAAWQSNVAYTGGEQVTFNGHLWTAKWWTEADQPGGVAGDWTDDGACTTAGPVKGAAPEASLTPASAASHVSSASAKTSGSAAVSSAAAPTLKGPSSAVKTASAARTGSAAVESASAAANTKSSRFFRL